MRESHNRNRSYEFSIPTKVSSTQVRLSSFDCNDCWRDGSWCWYLAFTCPRLKVPGCAFLFFFFVYGGAPPPFPSKVDYKMMAVGLEEKVSRSSFELIDGGRRLQELCRKVHLVRDI